MKKRPHTAPTETKNLDAKNIFAKYEQSANDILEEINKVHVPFENLGQNDRKAWFLLRLGMACFMISIVFLGAVGITTFIK